MDDVTYFERLVKQRAISAGIGASGIDSRYALVHKVAMAFPEALATDGPQPATPTWGSVIVSDTGELTWNRERPGKAYWTVDTPNTKLFSGFPEGREVTLNGVKLAIGPTRLGGRRCVDFAYAIIRRGWRVGHNLADRHRRGGERGTHWKCSLRLFELRDRMHWVRNGLSRVPVVGCCPPPRENTLLCTRRERAKVMSRSKAWRRLPHHHGPQ